MNLFRRNAPQANKNGHDEPISHRLTLDLSRADKFAAMVANSRASRVVEVSDLLAGMYIYNWERLSRYWDYDDQERVEEVLRNICQISPARWNVWIQQYDKQRRSTGKRLSSLPLLRGMEKEPTAGAPPQRSAELNAVLKQAEEIAPFHDDSGGRNLPILTSECVLLCIVRNRKSEISRKLASSGLNVPQLERDALSSRRSERGS
jgi:hypothetical protein